MLLFPCVIHYPTFFLRSNNLVSGLCCFLLLLFLSLFLLKKMGAVCCTEEPVDLQSEGM